MSETKTVSTTTMWLPVKLTEHELAGVAKQIGDARAEVDEYEAKAKSAAAAWKDKARGAKAKAAELEQVARTGQQDREVEVSELHDYRLGVVRTVRADTGAVVSERAMFSHERQGTLPIDESTPALHDGDDDGGPPPPESGDITEPQTVLDADPTPVPEGRVVRRRKPKASP